MPPTRRRARERVVRDVLLDEAAPREEEFVDRIRGLSYQEIAARGGGILNSAMKLRGMSEDSIYFGATLLTAITDNAALTYLGSQVEGLSEEFKRALVAGAVTGGGLTVVANAPNPAGFAILRGQFEDERAAHAAALARCEKADGSPVVRQGTDEHRNAPDATPVADIDPAVPATLTAVSAAFSTFV